MHWNSAEKLPPVDCPLLIKVNKLALEVVRTSHIESKERDMEYLVIDGALKGMIVVGRFDWTYP